MTFGAVAIAAESIDKSDSLIVSGTITFRNAATMSGTAGKSYASRQTSSMSSLPQFGPIFCAFGRARVRREDVASQHEFVLCITAEAGDSR